MMNDIKIVEPVPAIGVEGKGVKSAGKGFTNGAKMSTNEALDAAEDFLGPGYKNMGNGRFVSADGTRQVRMGDSDILGQHGGGPHINFEVMMPILPSQER